MGSIFKPKPTIMKVKVKITKEVLRRSASCKTLATNCAIAEAVREIFPTATVAPIGTEFGYSAGAFVHIPTPERGLGARITIPLPKKAQLFIDEFDTTTTEERLAMNELDFEIDVPNEAIDRIGIGQAYKILSEARNLELVCP